jgi:hypothetical protein
MVLDVAVIGLAHQADPEHAPAARPQTRQV